MVIEEFRFYVPLDTLWVILEVFFPANLLANNEETKPSTRKERITKYPKYLC